MIFQEMICENKMWENLPYDFYENSMFVFASVSLGIPIAGWLTTWGE